MHDRPEKARIYLVCDNGADTVKKAKFDKAFIRRVRVARESSGKSRKEVASILGIHPDTYARYEIRIMMPHHHIATFARATGISLEYLLGPAAGEKKARLESI